MAVTVISYFFLFDWNSFHLSLAYILKRLLKIQNLFNKKTTPQFYKSLVRKKNSNIQLPINWKNLRSHVFYLIKMEKKNEWVTQSFKL